MFTMAVNNIICPVWSSVLKSGDMSVLWKPATPTIWCRSLYRVSHKKAFCYFSRERWSNIVILYLHVSEILDHSHGRGRNVCFHSHSTVTHTCWEIAYCITFWTAHNFWNGPQAHTAYDAMRDRMDGFSTENMLKHYSILNISKSNYPDVVFYMQPSVNSILVWFT